MASERSNLSLALLIGIPVLAGASCFYLYYSHRSRGKGNNGTSDDKSSCEKSNIRGLVAPTSPSDLIKSMKQAGNQHFSRKDYEKAIELYSKAIEKCESLDAPISSDEVAILFQNRAAANEALGNFDQVIADCSKAIELKKKYAKAYLRRAKAYEKLKEYDKAMRDAFSANLLEEFKNQSSISMTETIVQASSKAKAAEAMKTHKFDWPADQTVKLYFTAFPYDPIKEKLGCESITSSEQLRDILHEANKPENDNDPLSLLIRGSCMSLMGDLTNSRVVFDKLLAMSDDVCPPKMKANALIKKSSLTVGDPNLMSQLEKDLESALKILSQAAQIDPENPGVYLQIAQTMTLLERLDDAVVNLDKAIEFCPKFYSAIAQKLYLEFKMATKASMFTSVKPEDLLKKFEDALEEHGDAPEIEQMYAQALADVGRFEEADQVYLKLIKKDPKDFGSILSRALLRFQIDNDINEIASMMRNLVKENPKGLVAYEILGSLESQMGKTDDAIAVFEKALSNAQSEVEYTRCFGLLDSARNQKAAVELLGMQL